MHASARTNSTPRIRRLAEELDEAGIVLEGTPEWTATVLGELDYAMHPRVHERRVPTYGAIVAPGLEAVRWEATTNLAVTLRDIPLDALKGSRMFADGLSSWVVRPLDDADGLAVFDRPAGSERDLVLLAEAAEATVVQRHPMGVVRVAGEFGVLRWDGIGWHHQAPVAALLDAVTVCSQHGDADVLETLLELAVHDLGARGIGAILVYRPVDEGGPPFWESRLTAPPPLRVTRPADLAPLVHVLTQIDGAAVFDADGTMSDLGVRLVPSIEAEASVEGMRGMRHTSGRRYSFDDPNATVIVVSEDGPVTVFRAGKVRGGSI